MKHHDEPVPAISGLALIHASPDAPAVNLFIGQNMVNNDIFSYGDRIDYVNAYSGTRDVAAYVGSDKKVSGKVTLEQGKMYSLFLAGQWANAEFVLLEDSLFQPDAGKANIRFLNMSPEAPALDLGLDDGTTLISNKEYKQNSGFIAVNGNTQYNFVIREHGSTADKVSLPAVTLQSGHIYTIWAKGIYTETGTKGPDGEIPRNY